MAARLNPRNAEMVRDRIKSVQLVEALQNHALGEKDMQSTQVRAALGLLAKCVPDLTATSLSNPDGSALNFTLLVPPKNG